MYVARLSHDIMTVLICHLLKWSSVKVLVTILTVLCGRVWERTAWCSVQILVTILTVWYRRMWEGTAWCSVKVLVTILTI